MNDVSDNQAHVDSSNISRRDDSSPDELGEPPKKRQRFTLEIPMKSRPTSEDAEDVVDPNLFVNWKGWVELENHPMIFSTLLREWGAPTVDVREIVELDSLFEHVPESTYGLILLSRWTPAETENEITEASPGVWFANQVQSYSCATVALLNIIMNHPELDLGQSLNEFRASTTSMKPLDRGWALDRNDEIRNVHNSFGTQVFSKSPMYAMANPGSPKDKLKIDHKLQQDFIAWQKKQKQEKAAKEGKLKGKRGRKKKSKKDDDEEDEENGFHFIAYVPAAGAVWKMDGMERLPRKLGDLEPGDNWLGKSLADLQGMWEKAMVNQFEVSLMSLVERTDHFTIAKEIEQMEEAREDWGPLLTTLLKIFARKGTLKESMGDS